LICSVCGNDRDICSPAGGLPICAECAARGVEPFTCSCGFVLNGATPSADTPAEFRPTKGDLTACVHCGAVYIFEDLGRLRSVTEDELATFSDEDRRQLEQLRKAYAARRLTENN